MANPQATVTSIELSETLEEINDSLELDWNARFCRFNRYCGS